MLSMDAAVAAVLGAAIGAAATVVGTLLSARQQGAQQHAASVRQRKEVAYSNVIRSLLRVRNRRSAMSGEGTYIAKEDIGTFFNDLVDAQHWLAMLTTACEAKQHPVIERASSALNDAVDRLVQHGLGAVDKHEIRSGPKAFATAFDDVVAAARDDLGTEA